MLGTAHRPCPAPWTEVPVRVLEPGPTTRPDPAAPVDPSSSQFGRIDTTSDGSARRRQLRSTKDISDGAVAGDQRQSRTIPPHPFSKSGPTSVPRPQKTNAATATPSSSTSTITTDPTNHSAGPTPSASSGTTSPRSTPIVVSNSQGSWGCSPLGARRASRFANSDPNLHSHPRYRSVRDAFRSFGIGSAGVLPGASLTGVTLAALALVGLPSRTSRHRASGAARLLTPEAVGAPLDRRLRTGGSPLCDRVAGEPAEASKRWLSSAIDPVM